VNRAEAATVFGAFSSIRKLIAVCRFAKPPTSPTSPGFGTANKFGSNMATAAVPGGNRITMAAA
jgi:hypothetical protein